MENQVLKLKTEKLQAEYFKQDKAFQELMMYNRCAIREIETKLQVLDEEFSISTDRNPIQTIKSRIKKPLSIVEKLKLRGIEVTVENMEKELTVERYTIFGVSVKSLQEPYLTHGLSQAPEHCLHPRIQITPRMYVVTSFAFLC